MELFDTVGDFLSHITEMKYLITIDGKTVVSYLADILNEKLQRTNKHNTQQNFHKKRLCASDSFLRPVLKVSEVNNSTF